MIALFLLVASALAATWDIPADWTVYDPGGNVVAVTPLGGGVYEVEVAADFGADGAADDNDVTGANAGVTLYREVADATGAPMDLEAAWVDHLRLADLTPVGLVPYGVFVGLGWLEDLPSVSGAEVRFVGCRHGTSMASASPSCGTVTGTTAATNVLASSVQESIRAYEVLLPRLGLYQYASLLPAAGTDGSGNLVTETLFSQTGAYVLDEDAAESATVYRAVFIGETHVYTGGATRKIRLFLDEGVVVGEAPHVYGGEHLTAPPVTVWLIGDSTSTGNTSSHWLPVAVDALLHRPGWSADIAPVRWVGTEWTTGGAGGRNQSISGRVQANVANGRTLATIDGSVNAWAAGLSTAPDVVVICGGYNDASTTTGPAMVGLIESIAGKAKMAFPAATVVAVAQPLVPVAGAKKTNHDALVASLLAAPPTNVDVVWDWSTGWATTMQVSATDGHPSLPSTAADYGGWDSLDYANCGMCAVAYWAAEDLTGLTPPLAVGETAP